MLDERLAAEVTEIKDASSLKIRFNCGLNDEGKTIVRSRTYSNVKPIATALDVYNVAETLASLQQHTMLSVVKQDNTNLSA